MTPNDHAGWTEAARRLDLRTRAFIGGRTVDAASGETLATVNPATGGTLAEVAACGAEDVDRAVAIARRAFESGTWSRTAPAERKRRMVRFAEVIEAHRDELALLELAAAAAARPVAYDW